MLWLQRISLLLSLAIAAFALQSRAALADLIRALRRAFALPASAEVTLWAADEGVLMLTGYRTPDPFRPAYAHHELDVVTAINAIRGDDDKRYRLLAALAEDNNGSAAAWQLLFDECPWLRDCDTAFGNERWAANHSAAVSSALRTSW